MSRGIGKIMSWISIMMLNPKILGIFELTARPAFQLRPPCEELLPGRATRDRLPEP
jgi:hypothetical protein